MKKNFYITTTLPYVNADPHVGFALEIIQADVMARYKRSMGYNVFFNTGTDEHGLKIFQGAQKENIDPKKYCDLCAQKNIELKGVLNLSYNNFIRTTDKNHEKSAQEFWLRCFKKGDIYKKKYKIKYCVGCELEKTESELSHGKCLIHPNKEIEIIEEENYFFKYSNYQKNLLDFYKKNNNFVIPESRFNEIKKFTKNGLQDFSISRLKEKMPWGVPVPNDSEHVMYVWFDALVNYISSLSWPKNLKKFKEFWPGVQVAGKDNLRQQSSMWQAMLLSAGLPLSKQIFIHGFINSGGQKMSKSLGNVINPIELVKKYGTDAVRYYLLREIHPTEDGDFTYEKFEQRYNSDLAGGIGNLVSRVKGIAKNEVNLRIQGSKESKFKIAKAKKEIKKALEYFKFNEAIFSLWQLFSFCDKKINDEKLWETKNLKTINDILYIIKESAVLLYPFLPKTSERILEEIKLENNKFKNKKIVSLFPRT